jgi:hypothetical protein
LYVSGHPELVAHFERPKAAASGFVGLPTFASRAAVLSHGHERFADGIERRRETAEATESHGGGGQEMNPGHAAGIPPIEGDERPEPPPRSKLPPCEGLDFVRRSARDVGARRLEIVRVDHESMVS